MIRITCAAVYISLLCSCTNEKRNTQSAIAVNGQDSPAGLSSGEPYLFTDKKGIAYLSWIERTDSVYLFKYAALQSGKWSEPTIIASGSTWFVNWADYPMMATDGGQNFISHILNKSGESTYAYDVKMYTSNDGGVSWKNSFVLHDDAKKAEHGFVSLVPYRENIFVAWLDGRNTVMEGMEGMNHDGHHGAMSLRGAIIDYKGVKLNEWELDNKTCDCCQTTATITSNGPVVIYRDRSDDEIRDMSIVRFVGGQWTKPQSVHEDHWKIKGCPVNGPRVSSINNNLAIAWFTVEDKKPEVKIVFSDDGGETFGEPIRVDEGKPIGRVDVVMLDADNAMVSWMEGTEIKAVRVSIKGDRGTSITIISTSESRSSGFPQMTKAGDELIFAWTDDQEKKVKVSSVKFKL